MKPDNQARLEAVFREVLALPADTDLKKVRQLNQAAWDSLGHVSLMAALEGEFGIALDTSEMLELTSFEAVRLFLEGKGQ